MMRDYRTHTGFIISTYDAKEADKVLVVLNNQGEQLAMLAKGVKKGTSRKSHAVDLLNLVQYKTETGVQLPVLTEVRLINNFAVVKQDFTGLLVAQAICELTKITTAEGSTELRIYQLLERLLNVWNATQPLIGLEIFMIRLLTISGVLPNLGIDAVTGEELNSEQNIYWAHEVGFTNQNEMAADRTAVNRLYKTCRFWQIGDIAAGMKINISASESRQILIRLYSWSTVALDRQVNSLQLLVNN
jgi:DNA repair protein RecO